MKRTGAYAVVVTVGLVMSVKLTGCSLLGGVTGAAIDAGKQPTQTVATKEVARFEPGDSLVLHRRIAARTLRTAMLAWPLSPPPGH